MRIDIPNVLVHLEFATQSSKALLETCLGTLILLDLITTKCNIKIAVHKI